MRRREIIDNKNNWKNIPENHFFPSNIEKYKLFERKIINKNLIKINKLKNTNIYVSRENALPEDISIEFTNVIWTSGIKTWKKLAKKGYWVKRFFR